MLFDSHIAARRRALQAAILSLFLCACAPLAARDDQTLYLDERLESTCKGDYSIERRDCSGGDGTAFPSLDAFHRAQGDRFLGGDTLFVREGRYWAEGHGLKIVVAGTERRPTVVRAFPGEQRRAWMCSSDATCGSYNPNPNVCNPKDSDFGLSARYYPGPAIAVHANHVEVRGFRTFGQVKVAGGETEAVHHVLIEGNDIGGGGPSTPRAANQGMVVYLHAVHDVTVRNNRIHHSTCGESRANGAALMGYSFHAIIENNTFSQNLGPDIRWKDVRDRIDNRSRVGIVRRNVFLGSGTGSAGIAQYPQIRRIDVHDNLFVGKSTAVEWDAGGIEPTRVFRNTFVDQAEKDVGSWIADRRVHAEANLHVASGRTRWFYFFEDESMGPDDLHVDSNCYVGRAGWRLGAGRFGKLKGWRKAGPDPAGRQLEPFFDDTCMKDPGCVADAISVFREEQGADCGVLLEGQDARVGVDWTLPAESQAP